MQKDWKKDNLHIEKEKLYGISEYFYIWSTKCINIILNFSFINFGLKLVLKIYVMFKVIGALKDDKAVKFYDWGDKVKFLDIIVEWPSDIRLNSWKPYVKIHVKLNI